MNSLFMISGIVSYVLWWIAYIW